MEFRRVMESGPLERAVRSLWGEYQTKPIRHVRHLWRLWQLHREFDLTPPSAEEWTWGFQRGRIPDCFACLDNCCRGPHNTVLLRLVDVALFVDRGWTDMLTWEKPHFSEEVLSRRPMLRDMLRSFHWRIFPVLKQDAMGRCVFLSEEQTCTIHPHRPWVCRTFPYTLDIPGRRIGWRDRCELPVQAAPQDPTARALEQAILHNFYTEKIRDLVLVKVYKEELHKMGITRWLRLD